MFFCVRVWVRMREREREEGVGNRAKSEWVMSVMSNINVHLPPHQHWIMSVMSNINVHLPLHQHGRCIQQYYVTA